MNLEGGREPLPAPGVWTPPAAGPVRDAPRAGGRRGAFAAGLVLGAAGTGALMLAWSFAPRTAAPVATPDARVLSRETAIGGESQAEATGAAAVSAIIPPTDVDSLPARWESLRGEFLEAATPVIAALDRADRLAAELPARQLQTRDAEAAYQAAKVAREAAEKGAAGFSEGEAQVQQQSARAEVALAEAAYNRLKAHTDDLKRSRQRLIDTWVAQGHTRAAAESGTAAMFYKDLKSDEPRIVRAEVALNQAKSRLDQLTRYTQGKQAKVLQSEVEARKRDELALQTAWEQAKTEESRVESALKNPPLSPEESRLLDLLAVAVRGPDARPPRDADPEAFRAFVRRFTAALNDAQTVSRTMRVGGVAGRYNAVVARLLRARGGADRE